MKLWRGQPDNWIWKPTAREIARAWIGLGAAFAALACYAFWFPSASMQTGRWAWLYKMAIATFGPQGDVILYAIVALIFLGIGVRKYRSGGERNIA